MKRSYRGYTTLNDFIKGKRREIDEIIMDCQRRKMEPTLDYVEKQYELLNQPALLEESKDFYQLYDRFIEANRGKKAPNTTRQQALVCATIKAFEQHTGYVVTLESITMDFHSRLTSYLVKERNFAPNTIGLLITCLKAFMGSLTEFGINTNLHSVQRPSASSLHRWTW